MTNLNLNCKWKLVMLPWQLNEIKFLSIKITKINNIKNKPIKMTKAHDKITIKKSWIKKLNLIHPNKYYTNKTKISRVTTAVVHYITYQHVPLKTNKQKVPQYLIFILHCFISSSQTNVFLWHVLHFLVFLLLLFIPNKCLFSHSVICKCV